MGARTYPEAYFAENKVAIPPSNFCTQISIRKPYGIYNQNFKRKVVGWNGGGVLQRLGLYPKGRDEWDWDSEEERRPQKMMDALTMRARARNLGARVVVGSALCSWPITSAEAPHPSPHSPPTRRSSRHFPSKYFQGNRPKMEASSSHAPMLRPTPLFDFW